MSEQPMRGGRTRTSATALLVMVTIGLACALFGVNLIASELNRWLLALPGIDKILHVAFYFTLFLCVRALLAAFTTSAGNQTWMAVTAVAAVALSDEFVQGFTSSRSVEAGDLVANASGIALGWVTTARPSRRTAVAVTLAALSTVLYLSYGTYAQLIDYSRALQAERRHDFETARQHYLRALASGLRTPAVYNGLAWVEVESGGDPGAALEHARLARDAEPDNPDVLDTYGWALHYAGQSAAAIQPLLDAYAAKPSLYCIHYHLGAVYLALGRPGEAELHLRRQLELPDTREAAMAERVLARMYSAP